VRKDTDGFVARHLNRPLSLQLTRAFIVLGLTPNQISVLGLLVGLAGAVVTLHGTHLALAIGAALYQLASVLDGSDGEVAKLTGRASARGSWIDTACDEVASVAYLAALPIGVYRGTGQPRYLALGGFFIIALVLLYAILIAYLRRTASHGSMLQVLADVREASRRPGPHGAVCRLMLSLSFMVRRDFFSFLALVVCVVGLGTVAVWTVAAILGVAMVFLIWFTVVGKPTPATPGESG
jgi:phosphatidylglycerophosphate synthase